LIIIQNENKTKLRDEDIERIIRVAENATRKYINSNLPRNEIEDLEISVEVETNGDLKVDIEVDVGTLSDDGKHQEIVEAGVEAAHMAVKDELDKIMRR
jgi:Holliday junction resolvase